MFMDRQAYLNQISQTTKPIEQKESVLSPKIFKFAAIGIGLTIFLVIIGSLLKNLNNKEFLLTQQLDLRTTNLIETIEEYNKQVKSPALRSIGTSFSAILSDTNRDIEEYLVQEYEFDPKKADAKIMKQETELIDDLNKSLENARLNGILDRTYVNKLDLQITLMLSLESDIISRTKKPELRSMLEKSSDSLKTLQNTIEGYDNAS